MSTSKLQRIVGNKLDKEFPYLRIRENYRPDWLLSSNNTILELDYYIEELGIAIEVQGKQHFVFTPFFHKKNSDFSKRLRFDQEKRDLCYGKGIKLFEISTESELEQIIEHIKFIYRDNQEPFLSKLQMETREAIERIPRTHDYVMADALCRKCIKKEKHLHSTIKKYMYEREIQL